MDSTDISLNELGGEKYSESRLTLTYVCNFDKTQRVLRRVGYQSS